MSYWVHPVPVPIGNGTDCRPCTTHDARLLGRIARIVTTGRVERGVTECVEDGCTELAAVRLYVPWAADRNVCTAHGRALVQQDGVVAEPLEGAAEDWR